MTVWRILRGRRREDGASAVEYGLLVAGIAGLVAAIVFLFGGAVKGLFTGTCDSIRTGGGSNISVQQSCT
jgi:pilus assembly protein Flp/PilA